MNVETNSADGRNREWRRCVAARAECIAMCGALTAKLQIAEAEYKNIAPSHTFPAFAAAVNLVDKAMDLLSNELSSETE